MQVWAPSFGLGEHWCPKAGFKPMTSWMRVLCCNPILWDIFFLPEEPDLSRLLVLLPIHNVLDEDEKHSDLPSSDPQISAWNRYISDATFVDLFPVGYKLSDIHMIRYIVLGRSVVNVRDERDQEAAAHPVWGRGLGQGSMNAWGALEKLRSDTNKWVGQSSKIILVGTRVAQEWGILTTYHEGDCIFSAMQAGLLPPEGDSPRVASRPA